MNRPSVQEFFDALAGDYAAQLERCVPRYREMLGVLLDYLPAECKPRSILELGCGTGNLSALLAGRFPESAIRLVDVSGESLERCRARLGVDARFSFQQEDFRRLAYEESRFDLVVSSISIHHLSAAEKQTLFAGVHRWLTRGGILAYADQFAGAAEDLYQRHMQHWKQHAFGAGATPQEWETWMRHQAEHDHHDPLPDQIDWLRDAGFSLVDCPWRYLLWCVVQARKGSEGDEVAARGTAINT